MELVKYGNRKLYDVNESTYVTLSDVGKAVKAGQEVTVLENKTKRDITDEVLEAAAFAMHNLDRTALIAIIKGGNA